MDIKNRFKDVNYCSKCGSKLQIELDRENKTRPVCPDCGWVYYKNPIPAAACLITNEFEEIVIIKRKFPPHPGEWALPSGYIEIYQSPEDAAIAEMKEETNLDGEIDYFIDYYDGFSPLYEKVISFGYKMKIVGGNLQAGDDAVEAKFVKFENLPELCFDAHKHYIKEWMKNREE